jgi:hypothetical protein
MWTVRRGEHLDYRVAKRVGRNRKCKNTCIYNRPTRYGVRSILRRNSITMSSLPLLYVYSSFLCVGSFPSVFFFAPRLRGTVVDGELGECGVSLTSAETRLSILTCVINIIVSYWYTLDKEFCV